MSGIYRDVFVYHTPDVTLWDAYVDTELNNQLSAAQMRLRYTLRNNAGAGSGDLRIRMSLRDPDGAIVSGGALIDEPIPSLTQGVNEEKSTAVVTVSRPKLWSHETPHIYDALIELISGEKVIEVRRVDVGFRKIELRDQQYWLNGKSIKIKGVNRHESSPTGGYTLTRYLMENDLALIKQANVNFVRCSHYPNDPRWYELCNRWGMLLMDEANVESHDLSYHKKVLPGDDPQWLPAVVERMRRLVVRDRNHPCVAMWSLGNESGYGKGFFAMRQAALAADPQHRPIQYADMNMAADVDSQTYPTTEWLLEHVAGKAVRKGEHGEIGVTEQHGPYPSGRGFVTNEYAHAHQNALGNLKDYWDVFNVHPMLWGGFIWEWADQTLYKMDENGQYFHAYGGDFGDKPNDGRFCIKGLVSADREPRPHYWEAKKVHQFVRVTPIDMAAGRVRIENHYSFTPLNELRAQWVLEEDGREIRSGELYGINAVPGKHQDVVIPWGAPKFALGREYWVTLRFSLRRHTHWAAQGHIVAWEQCAVPTAAVSHGTHGDCVCVPTMQKTGADYVILAGPAQIRINGQSGYLSSINKRGRELLRSPIIPNFTRVPTDSDIGWQVPQMTAPWQNVASQSKLLSLTAHTTAEYVEIAAEIELTDANSMASMTYRVRGDGRITVTMQVNLPENAPEPARIGMTLSIPADMNSVRWFGRGPQENYRDRNAGAAIGLYESAIDDFVTPYVRPQENANRTDVRWCSLTDATGAGLKISQVQQAFSFSAWPNSADDLDKTPHQYQLPKRDFITLNIDAQQMGIGGDSSWGLPVHPEYRIKQKGAYTCVFELVPV